MNRAYGVALVCGALPLVAGISIFLAWLFTRAQWLWSAGYLTLGGGMVVFLVGVAALIRYYRRAAQTAGTTAGRRTLATLLAGSLLLVNFPAAGVIVFTVIKIETSYTVVIHNETGRELSDARVKGGGCIEVLGSIAPGATARRTFWIRADGRLEFTVRDGAKTHARTIDDYVTHSDGGHTTVTLHPDGAMVVVKREP